MVLDSHWATTVEFVVTAQTAALGPVHLGGAAARDVPPAVRLPRRSRSWPGDRGARPAEHGTWITAIDDHYLPIFYATTNLWEFLGQGLPDKRWISIGVCQTADTEDNLRLGRALGDAIADSDRRVLLIASGAMSHTFWPLRKLRDHEAAGVEHIFTPEAAAADAERLEWFAAGDHARVLDTMPEFYRYKPEARFGHYLMMMGALGEGDCRRPGRRYGEYENSVGTGQVHIWFDRPDGRLPQAAPDTARPGIHPPDRRDDRMTVARDPADPARRHGRGRRAAGRRAGRRRRPRSWPWTTPSTCRRSCPSKIICVHLNYASAGSRSSMTTLPPAPDLLPQAGVRAQRPRGAVVRPDGCKWLNYEGEIAIVIGRTARNIAPADAGDYIRGYTVANDYGLHDFRDTDAGSMLRVKGADTLCPLGPGLVEGWDFRGKRIRTLVNGEVRQDGNTDEMNWDMHYLVADIARTITLQPGDVLLSGTPAISRTVYPGDVVEVEVEGLGTLRNHIVEGPAPIRGDVGAQPTESEEVLSTAQGGDWEFRGIRKPRPAR